MGYGGIGNGGGGSGTPGGSNTELQYNNAGSFSGIGSLTYNSGSGIITVTAPFDVTAGGFLVPLDALILGNGKITIDTSVTDWSHGIFKYYAGEELGVVAMPLAKFTTPANGAVPTYNSTNDEFDLTVPAGGGNVSKVGTPVNNQVGVWTGDGTIEGDTDLTFDTATNTLTVGGPVVATSLSVSGASAGTVTLAEGSAPSLVANTVSHYAAVDVPAGGVAWVWGSEAATTGFMLATNAAGVMTVTHIASTGSGNVARATSPTFVTPTLGAASATSINGLAITSSTGTLTITNGKTASFSNSVTFAGTDSTTMTCPGETASLGYLNIPQNSKSAAYTTVLLDAGKHILHPSSDNNARTFTIDSNANVAYPIGTTLTFINEINTVTIAITSDTLTLAGAGTTGSRTLAANGIATAVKIASTKWIINGTGLT